MALYSKESTLYKVNKRGYLYPLTFITSFRKCPYLPASIKEYSGHLVFSEVGVLLEFLMPDRINILQAHRITAVALHLGVFQGIVFFLRKAIW